MSIEIILAGERDRQRWDDYVLSCPDASPYQLYPWRSAVEEAYGFAGVYLMAEESGRVVGVLPLIDFCRPLMSRTLVSLPYCDCGGVLADDSSVAERLMTEARNWARSVGVGAIEIRTTVGQPDSGRISGKVRMILPLPASADELLAGLKAKVRSQVKKPQRDGLRAVVGGAELVETFYRVWAVNMHELGSPVHSRDWFRQILAGYAERARIGVVYTREGEPAAAGLILLAGHSISIPWASSLRRLNFLNPNMLLYWTFLSFAAERGYRSFDFGRSTVGEGTYHFKRQWGALPQRLEWVAIDDVGACEVPSSVPTRVRSQVESVWRHLPLGLCNRVGPMLRRYVSL